MSQAPSKTPGGPQSTVLEKTKPAGKPHRIVRETGKEGQGGGDGRDGGGGESRKASPYCERDRKRRTGRRRWKGTGEEEESRI